MSKIEAVIFDAGGVLHESNSATRDDLTEELALSDEALDEIWSTQMPQLDSGGIDESEFWRQVREKYGIREVSVAENLLGRAFTEALRPRGPVAEFIQELGNHGIKLAVLSNTIEPHARALREAGLYDGFDYLILSHEVGLRKPDERIYRLALDSLGVGADATVFVDDDKQNTAAAKVVGMKTVEFTDADHALAELYSLIRVT